MGGEGKTGTNESTGGGGGRAANVNKDYILFSSTGCCRLVHESETSNRGVATRLSAGHRSSYRGVCRPDLTEVRDVTVIAQLQQQLSSQKRVRRGVQNGATVPGKKTFLRCFERRRGSKTKRLCFFCPPYKRVYDCSCFTKACLHAVKDDNVITCTYIWLGIQSTRTTTSGTDAHAKKNYPTPARLLTVRASTIAGFFSQSLRSNVPFNERQTQSEVGVKAREVRRVIQHIPRSLQYFALPREFT